ncbi:MAG TPA: GtrA family protein [Steroidobacteraceae bacterium]|nr:GtrA family protein [Steroidobacteraceae bacterium]
MSLARPLKFLATGLANTAVGLGVIYAGMWAGLGDLVANLVGYAVGLTVSFTLNRRWTFEHRGHAGRAALRFALSVCVAYAANVATLLAVRDGLGLSSWLAQAAAVAPYTVILYLLSAHFVFPEGRSGGPGSASAGRE